MKLVVIVADAAGYANAGLDVERYTKSFDLPPEIEKYIRDRQPNQYCTLTFALEDQA